VEALRRYLELGTGAVAEADALRAQSERRKSGEPNGVGVVKQPETSVMVEIPDCRVEASVFKRRRALRRFVRLRADILAAPSPDHDTSGERVKIVSAPK
jgi:hypothetical protein